MNIPDIIIAIDGYSSTGKSSFAKIIANEFSFLYLDSGALYRGVTLFAIENGFINDNCEIDVPGLDKALEDIDLHFGEGGAYIGDRCQRHLKSLFSFVPVTHWFVGILSRVPCYKSWFDMLLHQNQISQGTSHQSIPS